METFDDLKKEIQRVERYHDGAVSLTKRTYYLNRDTRYEGYSQKFGINILCRPNMEQLNYFTGIRDNNFVDTHTAILVAPTENMFIGRKYFCYEDKTILVGPYFFGIYGIEEGVTTIEEEWIDELYTLPDAIQQTISNINAFRGDK